MPLYCPDSYFDGISCLPQQGIIETDLRGKIVAIHSTKDLLQGKEITTIEGVIVPGFINAHCHLELSHLQQQTTLGKGLAAFIASVFESWKNNYPDRAEQCIQADCSIWDSGTVAVGDHSNTGFSFLIKCNSPIYYHTFVELTGLDELQAENIIDRGKTLLDELHYLRLQGSIIPHAPYSLSSKLIRQVFALNNKDESIISIHNQESEEENTFFSQNKGELVTLFRNRGLPIEHIQTSGKSSLLEILPFIPSNANLLLVHNVFTSQNELEIIQEKRNNTFFVLCPESNLNIVGRLPDIDMFRKMNASIALGTDSLASVNSLSMFQQIKTIAEAYPAISTGELIRWASHHGARALRIDKKYGSIEPGKHPGLNVLKGLSNKEYKVNPQTVCQKLL